MKNFEKYKTAEERANAFSGYCLRQDCNICWDTSPRAGWGCIMKWLDLEAEEEPLPCPYCGREVFYVHKDLSNLWTVECNTCLAQSKHRADRDDAIADYNRVARAVMEAKKEVTNG